MPDAVNESGSPAGARGGGVEDGAGRADSLDDLTAMSLDLLDQLAAARGDVLRMERELRERGDAVDRVRALEDELHWARERALVAEERTRQVGAELEAARREVMELHQLVGEMRSRAAHAAETEAIAAVGGLRIVLGLPEGSNLEQVSERVRGLVKSVQDRNRWIASLLAEVVGRRFKVGPRRLLDHEREFLERHRDELDAGP